MKQTLVLAPVIMIIFILFGGIYSFIVFVFIAAFALLPPIIFKYSIYPERALYFFFIIWISIPKNIRRVPFVGLFDLPGISYFDIIQTLAVLHIIILLLITKRRVLIPKNIWSLIYLFFFTILVSTIFGVIKYYYSYQSFPSQLLLGNIVEDFINPFYGLIILLGLFTFITQYSQVEKIIKIFAISGILILLDYFIFDFLGLFKFLLIWVSQGGRHKGFFFGDYMANGLFGVITSFAMAYFILKNKKNYLLPFLLLMLFPIQATYERTVYIAYFTGLITFALIYFQKVKTKYKVFLFFFLIIASLIFIYNASSFNDSLNSFYAGNVRKTDFTDSQSFYSRLAAWFRSFDVFVYLFPFGTGEGLSQQYLNAHFIPQLTGGLINQKSYVMYSSLISGVKTTKAHNIFVHYVSEHGLLGLITIYIFIKTILRNYSFSKKLMNKHDQVLFRAMVYAMIFGLGAYYMVESAERLYFLYSMLLFFSVFMLYVPKNTT